uniref:ORF5 n=1 Tax=Middle East respiratory syndrome-related coronavirus TaxID=1335626 RepID=A0A0G3VKB5_MERS|nr:ORF5 [Middle East respiratory syndrome-related coronavirus]
MAFSASLFKPVQLVPVSPAFHRIESTDSIVFTYIPASGYVAALAVNVCLIPLLLLLRQDTCRRSIIRTMVLYFLVLYNFLLAIVLVNGVHYPTGSCLIAFLVILIILWFVDRIRFCLMLNSYIPLFDMRSHFIRVSTVSSHGFPYGY